MALLSGREFTATVSRGLWRVLVPQYISQGLSFNKSVLDFRTYYPTFRRDDMLTMWRGIGDFIRFEKVQSTQDMTRRIGQGIMATYETPGAERFRVHYTYTAYDPLTGFSEQRRGSWYTNRYYSPDAWIRTIADELEADVRYEDTEIQDVVFKAVERNSAWGS